MSLPKIPNQFPWIVGAVVIAHGILAAILFSGSPESTSTVSEEKAPVVMKSTSSASVTSHPLISRNARVARDENGEITSRFPKRVPLQSELNGTAPPAEETTDVVEMADAVESVKADTEPKVEEQGRIAEPDSFSLTDLPSAVAAAKAAPVLPKAEKAEQITKASSEANRLRMVETTAPRPVPHTTRVAKREKPVTKPKEAPELVSKKAAPKKAAQKPVIAAPLKQIRALPIAQQVKDDLEESSAAAPRPGPGSQVVEPLTRSDGPRQFRVIKPIKR